MRFLVLTRRRAQSFPAEAFDSPYETEVARTRALYAARFTRQIWRRADRSGACQIVEAEARPMHVSSCPPSPLCRQGMLDIEIIALKPYAGFSC